MFGWKLGSVSMHNVKANIRNGYAAALPNFKRLQKHHQHKIIIILATTIHHHVMRPYPHKLLLSQRNTPIKNNHVP
jgi:hypothetical protein